MLQFETVTDLGSCQHLWQQFTPNEYLYDDWQFRAIFNNSRGFQPEFIVGYSDSEAIGILPLQVHIKDEKELNEKPPIYREFFGGYYMNNNRIFFTPEKRKDLRQYTAEFYAQVTKPYRLEYFIDDNAYLPESKFTANEYLLTLTDLQSADDYLEKYWTGKSKRKLKKFIRKVEELKPEMKLGDRSDLPTLFKLNIERFGEESSYNSEIRKMIFNNLFDLKLQIEILKIEVAGEDKAVSISILYNNVYYCLSSGIDLTVENISKYFNYKKIQRAIDLKATAINFLTGDYGYKHRWFPELIPTYSIINE